MFPQLLLNGLWHSTSLDLYKKIIDSEGIYPEPNIPETNRWRSLNSEKKYYPFVRSLKGVSLFDFNNFSPKEYIEKYPVSSLYTFVPGRRDWLKTVWIEIDKKQIANNFISGKKLLNMWKQNQAYSHNIMPIIECVHIGVLPTNYFLTAYIYNEKTKSFSKIKETQ